MKKALFILIPLILIVFFILPGGSSDEYNASIKALREEKHDFFRTSQTSPFVENNIEYVPVEFFPPDESYKVRATLNRLTSREIISIANSDGSEVKYLKFATANFNINDTPLSLIILKQLGFGNQYLTAFGDETSGISTYGGGRYLDLVIGNSDLLEIDFNKAYNPYCAYSPKYLCPLPPRENFLKVAIEAGEKDYKPE